MSVEQTSRLISYVLWGGDPAYLQGAIDNVLRQKVLFPGWVCRFYCDETVPVGIQSELKELGAEVIPVDRNDVGYSKLFWRILLPLLDDEVEIFICRDADSRLLEKDARLVSQWLKTDKSFHLIRDGANSSSAHLKPIQGGLFGVRKPLTFDLLSMLYDFIFESRRIGLSPMYGIDEYFLNRFVFSKLRDKHIAHIAMSAQRLLPTDILFEKQRDDRGYIGQRILADGEPAIGLPPANGRRLVELQFIDVFGSDYFDTPFTVFANSAEKNTVLEKARWASKATDELIYRALCRMFPTLVMNSVTRTSAHLGLPGSL